MPQKKTPKKRTKSKTLFKLDPQIAADQHFTDDEMDTSEEHAQNHKQIDSQYDLSEFFSTDTQLKVEPEITTAATTTVTTVPEPAPLLSEKDCCLANYDAGLVCWVAAATSLLSDNSNNGSAEMQQSRRALTQFIGQHETLKARMWNMIESFVAGQLGGHPACLNQPLYRALQAVRQTKELHTRLLKRRPGPGGLGAVSIWGTEELDGVTASYRSEPSYSFALLVPAATDWDPKASDEKPGGIEAQLREVCFRAGFDINAPPPLPVGVMATTPQVDLLRLVHAICHTFEYLNTAVTLSINGTKDLGIEATLKATLGPWRHKPIAEWSANPKLSSPFVVTAVKLRYSLAAAWDLLTAHE